MASSGMLGLLQRLSNKPGVQRAIILSRKTGAVLESFGYDSSENITTSADDTEHRRAPHLERLERDASLIYSHVQSATDLIVGLSEPTEDDLKLSRIRTKRHEFMIVPDSKYIAVVIRAAPTS